MSVVEELSGDGSRIVTSWKRTTVADGDWLQHNTISPLNERDVFLAEKIDELSGNADDRLDEEIAARIAGDEQLYDELSTVSSDFYSFSADVETSAYTLSAAITAEAYRREREDETLLGKIEQLQNATDVVDVVGTHSALSAYAEPLTKNDVVKVLVDETKNNLEYYWRVVGDKPQKPYQWTEVGTITPYYSKSEIDNKETELSATIANTYLSANGTDISAGKNLDVVIKSNNPRVAFKTKDDVSFTNVTSTNIQGTQANYTNFSGVYITGFNDTENLTATISGLINSAANGGSMTAIKNASGIMLNWDENKIFPFTTSADLISLYVSGGASEWIGFDIDRMNNAITVTGNLSPILENYLPVNWSGYNNSLFSGTSRSAQSAYSSQFAGSADLANSASIAANTQDKITAYYKEGNTNKTGTFNVSSLKLSAGKGINFVSSDNQLSISSEGTTYTTGQYINISNDNKISVTGDLINSAQSGQSAYNWITAQSATLSAGPGIKFTSANPNTMGITITAGGVGGVITAIAGSALSAGSNYIGGNYISINPNNNSINLSTNISADNISAHEIKIADANFSSLLDSSRLNITGNNLTYTASINLSYTNASYKCAGSAGTSPWSAIINNANSNWVSANPYGISISSDSVVKLVFTPTLPSTLDDNTYYIV